MNRLLHLLVVTVLLAAGVARAGAADAPEHGVAGTSFVAVDAFQANYSSTMDGSGGIVITGIVTGDSASRRIEFGVRNLSSCERMLTLSMERPGRYVVSIVRMSTSSAQTCELKRAP